MPPTQTATKKSPSGPTSPATGMDHVVEGQCPYSANSQHTATIIIHAMKRSSAPLPDANSRGGGVNARMMGWSVTTDTKMEMIQNEHRMASFWMTGMLATSSVSVARPSASSDTMAGA